MESTAKGIAAADAAHLDLTLPQNAGQTTSPPCGTCAGVCPTAAISVAEAVTTDIEDCIRCCACIKTCPEGARFMEDGQWKKIAKWLNENCSTRKEPQLFGIDR